MILRDVIRYYELTGCDFQKDLKDFAQLQRQYYNDMIEDDFMERYESFTDKLQTVWIDRLGGWEKVIRDEITPPNNDQLIEMYCRTIKNVEEKPEETTMFLTNSSLRKKKEIQENKTIDLVATLTNIDIPFDQFLDMELEVVYDVIGIVGEKKKEEEKKRKQRRKGR